MAGSRSHVLMHGGSVVAHGGIWPVQLLVSGRSLSAFHLVDWAAARDAPGAGMTVLRQCCSQMAAVFSIGGSAMTRKVLPAFGFKPYNPMAILRRPLRPFQPVLRQSSRDWKMPARLLRNACWYISPLSGLAADWSISPIDPGRIPKQLWPAPSAGLAVSFRSAALLAHIASCPGIQGSALALVAHKFGSVAGYILLVKVRNEVRLADYGPAGLDEETSRVLGAGAQSLARLRFPDAHCIMTATSEPSCRSGFLRSGFRLSSEEPVKVLKLDRSLDSIDRFRLTLLDWDALCL
jgi:hypothetical protein